MTEMISINITSMVLGLILPFWVALSICIALAIGKRLNTFILGDYVRQVVEENNKLIMENRKMKKELENDWKTKTNHWGDS